MIDVQVKRATAPVESVTLTLDRETARVVKALCGFGSMHISEYAQEKDNLVRGLTFKEAQRVGHSVCNAIKLAVGPDGLER